MDLAVQDTAATEDPADGSHRRQPPDLAGREDLMDNLGAMEPQVAGLLQLPPYGQDLLLDGGLGPRRISWGTRAVVPIDAIKPLALRMLNPVMDGGGAHTELPCDLSERSFATDGGYHGATAVGLTVPLVMMHLEMRQGFLGFLSPRCSGCSVT